MYRALYRKWRPQRFEDVVGQRAIVTALKNQITANRVGHAYLFTGVRGTGKTTCAKIFAKAVNCLHPVNGDPCGECEICKGIDNGSILDVVEMDAASNNGVDNIREIREEVSYRPTEGRYKVYIIDEVHMLSTGAFNALLKTLEEPPSYVIFILATTEAHKIPITILSRCQRYDFHRISIDTIAARLSELLKVEGVEAEEKAIRYVAKAGDGSMRDALSLLDQCIAFYLGQTLTYDKVLDVLGAVDTEVFSRLLRKVLAGDVTSAIRILEELIVGGRELSQFVGDFTWYMRNLLLVKTSDNPEEAIDVSSENLKLLKEESGMTDVETLMRYIRIFSDLSNQIRFASQKRVLVEIALIKLCRPAMETNLDSVLDRLRVLEKQMEERPVQQVIVRESEAGGAGEPGAAVTGTATVQQQKGSKTAQIAELAALIINIIRTQFIAILGNISIAIPVAALITFLWQYSLGEPLLSPIKAAKTLHDLNPFTSLAIPHAAIAGVCLFLSGLIAGYFDNLAVYRKVGPRLKQHRRLKRLMGQARLDKFANYIETNLGALAGNFLFGIMLGSMGTIGFILGLPLDIRHIAFASANFIQGLMTVSGAPDLGLIIVSFLGVMLIGLTNLFVSFTLTIIVALRARRVRFSQWKPLAKLVITHFLTRPSDFFWPPKQPVEVEEQDTTEQKMRH